MKNLPNEDSRYDPSIKPGAGRYSRNRSEYDYTKDAYWFRFGDMIGSAAHWAQKRGQPNVRAGQWRLGDQRYYVSDTRRFREATGWEPQVGAHDGVRRLLDWLVEMEAGLVEAGKPVSGWALPRAGC